MIWNDIIFQVDSMCTVLDFNAQLIDAQPYQVNES